MASGLMKDAKERMEKTISVYTDELKTVRAGRANPAILDRITVDYYGQQTPLNQVSNISVPEARLIAIQPWDASLVKEIEKAILKADIGLNPSNDGKIVRLIIPQLTEERRIELTKTVKKMGENSKVAIRNIRRELMDGIKNLEKNKEISEDMRKTHEKEAQDLTDEYIEKVDEITSKKEEELMEI
ncbi:MAG: ribosome recycling factor [Tissierellia bacterium]|nr:ribosome recycling factor [Tissierellia bacterium]